jgi:hypothetical protein
VPVTLARTEVWYKGVDQFGISKTTLIKKLEDSGQLSFISFQKSDEKPEPTKPEDELGAEPGADLGGPPEMPQGEPPPGSSIPPAESGEEEKKKEVEKEKEDITVTKSIPFKDDIKGAAILIKFLKKLDL